MVCDRDVVERVVDDEVGVGGEVGLGDAECGELGDGRGAE